MADIEDDSSESSTFSYLVFLPFNEARCPGLRARVTIDATKVEEASTEGNEALHINQELLSKDEAARKVPHGVLDKDTIAVPSRQHDAGTAPIANTSTTARPEEVQHDPAADISSGTGQGNPPKLLDTALRDVSISQVSDAVQALLYRGEEASSAGKSRQTYGTLLGSVLEKIDISYVPFAIETLVRRLKGEIASERAARVAAEQQLAKFEREVQTHAAALSLLSANAPSPPVKKTTKPAQTPHVRAYEPDTSILTRHQTYRVKRPAKTQNNKAAPSSALPKPTTRVTAVKSFPGIRGTHNTLGGDGRQPCGKPVSPATTRTLGSRTPSGAKSQASVSRASMLCAGKRTSPLESNGSQLHAGKTETSGAVTPGPVRYWLRVHRDGRSTELPVRTRHIDTSTMKLFPRSA